jgi:hypothetical protein
MIKTTGVRIQERNTILTSMNTDGRWSMDNLPEFFKPMRHVFEDDAFSKMSIQLQDVLYIITPIYGEQEATC